MKKAGDLLNGIFTEVQKKQGKVYNSFHDSWKEIAGEKIGNNSSIKDVIDGFLVIEIDHPGWKQLISLSEKRIIYKINKKFPELNLKKIKFYFKNNNKKVEVMQEEKVDNSDKIEVIENIEFKDLLKKMNKRSEE